MTIWQSLSGMARVELSGAALLDSIRQITAENIPIFELEFQDEITAEFLIRRADLKRVEKICHKNGDQFRTAGRFGSFWAILIVRSRPVLLAAVCVILLLTCFLPTRIFFVRVEGSSRIPKRQILEAAETIGIGFGASRREVRSEKIKNALLSAVPELQWAGVNTHGCVAVITVREQPVSASEPEDKSSICSIVADRDGIIVSCDAEQGTVLCAPGQAVRKGDILISGYTDCGICIRAVHSSGEIYAMTNHAVTAVSPTEYLEKGSVQKSRQCFSLLIGKKRINLYKSSRIWDAECDRIYKEYYVVLPGGFRLPLGIACEQIISHTLSPEQSDISEMDPLLQEFTRKYILNHMNAGSILSAQERFSAEAGLRILNFDCSCMEMIGIPHIEQIGENNGESS